MHLIIGMHKRLIYTVSLLLGLASIYTPLHSTTIDGGTGLIRVPYASTLGKSKLLVNGQAANTINKGTVYDGWYYAAMNQIGVIWGMNQIWDVWVNARLYQDNVIAPEEGWGNIKIGTKVNYFNNRRMRLNTSTEGLVILPTGRWENIQWEPFNSGNIEFQVNQIISYYKYYHGNFGYIFHNDADIGYDLQSGLQVAQEGAKPSHTIFFGLGGEYPIIPDILVGSAELTGRFMVNAKENIHSSEPWIILTLASKYFLSDNLFFSGGLDLRIIGGDNDSEVFDWSQRVGTNGFYQDNPNYPLWRLHFDFNWIAYQKYRVIRRATSSQADELEDDYAEEDEEYLELINDFGSVEVSGELQEKMKLYRELKVQQKETKEAEKELEEIKIKRKEAEKELQKLRNLLEDLD